MKTTHSLFLILTSLALLACGALFWSQRAAAQSDGGETPADIPGNFRAYLPLVIGGSGAISTPPPAGNRISNLEVTTANVARNEKFEVLFRVQTNAPYPDLPYDANPPAGVKPGIGVTVNALFSADNWATTLTQPAFRYQRYTHSIASGEDHFTPNGAPLWAVRFAPRQTGTWQYRLYVQDAAGEAYYPPLGSPALTLLVQGESANAYVRRGFVRVSETDPRYFEFDDGTPFIGLGFNGGYEQTMKADEQMALFEQNKMNFMRVWLSGDSINGSQWGSWGSHYLNYDGYLPGVYLTTQNTYNGGDVALLIDQNVPCQFTDHHQHGIPVEPNTTYTISARFKLENVQGSGGFVAKYASWLGRDCKLPGNGKVIIGPVKGSSDWQTLSGSYTTSAGQYWLNYLYLALENTTGGVVYVDEVKVFRSNDPAQVNLLREPNPNSHLYFDQMSSAFWDRILDSAQRRGVYLKLVIDEKNEWIRNRIGPDGKMTSAPNNNNFYAAPGTRGRWLQQAWWRYLAARWGYSTAIHSFEYINEGDPYNGNHHNAANSMAEYLHRVDASRHLVTTSFWSSFPNKEFWSNLAFSAIDYADLHAYISTGWGLTANFVENSRTETNPAYIHSGDASARIQAQDSFSDSITPRGMVIRGVGEWIIRYWMTANNFSANCPYNSTGGMQRIRWMVDGGKYWGGKEGVVPFNNQGKDFICTSPSGTFGWTEFRSDRDRTGALLPAEYRIILTDDAPHELSILLENSNGLGGSAWIDNVELISPGGAAQSVMGDSEITPMDEDTAWYNRAYASMWGGGSLVGAHKPLVRGETGIDTVDEQDWNRDLLRDTDGIWLHNNVWGQINDGAMSDLFWWSSETIPPGIYDNYLTFANFMAGIPIQNGYYRGVVAQPSDDRLRVWGQRDDTHGQMHLWIQNTLHTWKRVINGPAIPAISGTILIPNVAAGQYRVEWWNTYNPVNPVFQTQTITSNGSLTLSLPYALSDDIAVKLTKLP